MYKADESIIQLLSHKFNTLRIGLKTTNKFDNNPILKSNLSSSFTKHNPYKYHRKNKPKINTINNQTNHSSKFTFSNFGITTTKLYYQLKSTRHPMYSLSAADTNRKNRYELLRNTIHQEFFPITKDNPLYRANTQVQSSRYGQFSRKNSRSSCKSAFYRSNIKPKVKKNLDSTRKEEQFKGWDVKHEEDDNTHI